MFALKTGGYYPHTEDSSYNGVNFSQLLYYKSSEFWDRHCLLQKKSPKFFDKDFRELFINMTKQNPEERADLKQIKSSAWYIGPTLSNEELKATMKTLLEEVTNNNSSPKNTNKSNAQCTTTAQSKSCYQQQTSSSYSSGCKAVEQNMA